MVPPYLHASWRLCALCSDSQIPLVNPDGFPALVFFDASVEAKRIGNQPRMPLQLGQLVAGDEDENLLVVRAGLDHSGCRQRPPIKHA